VPVDGDSPPARPRRRRRRPSSAVTCSVLRRLVNTVNGTSASSASLIRSCSTSPRTAFVVRQRLTEGAGAGGSTEGWGRSRASHSSRRAPPPSVPALAVDLSRRRALVLRSTASPLRKPVRTRRGPATVTGERGPPCTTTARAREGPGDSRRRRPVLHRQSSRDRLGSRPYFAVKDPLIGLGPVRAVGERPHSAARTAPTTAASHSPLLRGPASCLLAFLAVPLPRNWDT